MKWKWRKRMLQELKQLVVKGSMMSDRNLLSSGFYYSSSDVYFNCGNKLVKTCVTVIFYIKIFSKSTGNWVFFIEHI
jgi:hypothetical protein